jgi:hypothetical protein
MLRSVSTTAEIPDPGDEFVFFNPKMDVWRVNVHLSSKKAGTKARLASITNWEEAAFLPRWWAATSVSGKPHVRFQEDDGTFTYWDPVLRDAFLQAGFPEHSAWYKEYRTERERMMDSGDRGDPGLKNGTGGFERKTTNSKLR